MFPQLFGLADLSLLLLRLMVAAIFVTSGWSHVRDPKGRAQSIGMSPGFTMILGAVELAGGLGVAFGVLIQLAATGLILVMLGALMNLVIACTGGGSYVLSPR